MTKVIQWGILGAGQIAHQFAKDLAVVNNAQLYAVASSNAQRAEQFALDFMAKEAYDNYTDLAKDPNVDAIYIATPHSFHKTHTLLCLNHNKAVLCEKPFAMDLKEVDEMISLAQENDVLLMEALWTAFLPHFQFAIDKVKTQHFGKLLKLEADFGFKPEYNTESRLFNRTLGGGSLLDIGIYPIFAALTALGEPKNIKAKASFFPTGVDATCHMEFNYKDARAILRSTFLENTKTEAAFFCENGIIKINSRFHQPSTVSLISQSGNEETIDFNYNSIGYSFEIDHFNHLLRTQQTESDIMTFKRSRQLIKTLDTVRHNIGLSYN
ncbi:MAG: Gfo/Idh/MocA family oxidoreductase [Winogradskyella sp.]|nr:Gfo/Idh/MocA family oxidoreductase [Winogradskyella sp.]